MIRTLASALALVLGTQAGHACQAELDWVLQQPFAKHPYAVEDQGTVGPDGTWCRLQDAVLSDQNNLQILVDSLRWQVEPTSISIILDGMRVVVRSGQDWVDYLMLEQSRFRVHQGEAVLRWSDTDRTGGISFRIGQGAGAGQSYEVSFVTTFDDVDLKSFLTGDPGAAAVSYSAFHISNGGLLDWMIYGLLANSGSKTSPEAQIRSAQESLTQVVDELPKNVIGPGSRFDLKRLVDSLPLARGQLRIVSDPENPVTLTALIDFGLAAFSGRIDAGEDLGLEVYFDDARDTSAGFR